MNDNDLLVFIINVCVCLNYLWCVVCLFLSVFVGVATRRVVLV